MSVINQMLKDLEQRTPEQGSVAMPVAISHKPSTIKIVLISFAVLVTINVLGFYIWNLQERVKSSELKVKEQVQQDAANTANTVKLLSRQPVETYMSEQEMLARQEPTAEKTSLKAVKAVKAVKALKALKAAPAIASAQQSVVKEKTVPSESLLKTTVAIRPPAQPELTKPERVSANAASHACISSTSTNAIVVNTPIESKISVSRRQLTSQELVAQTLVRAEKSIKLNDVVKAEQLFEEVLIIQPSHKQARKKLAALWFGRKSYQQATNLLSQGISFDKNDAELRLLKARIHLQQGQHKAAYNTLKPLPTIKQQEYQVMLANVSQQIEQYKSAIQAYKVLIDMQAYSGRWHLGLAIVYDKSSQFPLAVAEYALALTKSDLSIASAEFAQQRMQALEE